MNFARNAARRLRDAVGTRFNNTRAALGGARVFGGDGRNVQRGGRLRQAIGALRGRNLYPNG